MDLIFQDFEEINIERPKMTAKLIVSLEQIVQKGLLNNQSSGVAACARQIISLAGLAAGFSYNNQRGKTSNQFGIRSKAMTIRSASVEKGIVLW